MAGCTACYNREDSTSEVPATVIYVHISCNVDREKSKRMNFMCRACVEGERWEKEAREWKKKAMEAANKEGGVKERVGSMEKRDGEKNG